MCARRLLCVLPVLAALVLAAAGSGCGSSESTSVSEGQPVQLGDIQYNVLFSRFLNADDIEDHSYLVGQPQSGPDQLYLGVFLEVINKNKDARKRIPTNMYVTDTQHNTYDPLPTKSPYALRLGGAIGPEDQAPALDSTPQVGPIGGSMVLFMIPTTAAQDRPLKLIIPGSGGPATVQLDI
jgi:hypothetical protein